MKNRITFFATLFIVFTTINPLFSQMQMGENIDGEAAGDNSGWAVSLSSDGSMVAIGAPFNGGNGSNSGHVRVYNWNGVNWVQVGADIDGEAAGDNSGWAVSLSSDGSMVAIGAPLNGGNGSNSGHVRVYNWNGVNWVQVGADIDGEAAGDKSGWSVSLSSDGNKLAIGAPINSANGSASGHVRVYNWNGADWIQIGEDIDGEAINITFGDAVSLSSDGNRVAIGAPFNNTNGAGDEQIYEWNGGSWSQVGTNISEEAPNDGSGQSISLSNDGNRVAIGATSNDGNGMNAGHVRVFEWDGGNWSQIGSDIDGEGDNDTSGASVSLSSNGDKVAIGAPYNDGNGMNAGHARVFGWDGGSWSQIGFDIDGEEESDQSGTSVSLSSNGNRLAIGAIGSDGNGTGTDAGSVRVFEFETVSTNIPSIDVVIKAYPNPTIGKIKLSSDKYTSLIVLDNFGRIISKIEQPLTEIDISDLPPGIYFFQVNVENGVIVKKITKM